MSSLDFKQNLAIVVGIDRYGHGIPQLANSVSDASAIAHLLETKHGYTTTLLTNQKATQQHLVSLLYDILPKQVKSTDRLLFYFAGHGIALNGEDGPEGFLIPQDSRLGNTQTYLSMVQLQQALIALPCRHFLAIFDCCFAGAFRWSSTRDISAVPEVIHQERYERFLLDPAWQVITSTAYDQTALDSFTFQDARGQQGNHSPFALALLEALAGEADTSPPAAGNQPRGDGVITATELYVYLRDRIEPPTHQSRQRQTPSLFALGKHDKGEYIFLNPDHPLNLPPAPPLDPAQNPYRGLESFDEAHADLFFGRGDRITALRQQVTTHPFTAVIGPSGSGKSSLVKAGLIPQMRSESTWQILGPFRPSGNALKVLLEMVQEISGNSSIQQSALTQNSLATVIDTWSQAHLEKKMLIVIDQFEELLTLESNEAARSLFLQNLAQILVAERSRSHLTLTLRADFEPQFQSTALAPHWDIARFILAPMSRTDLRAAIEQPASAKVMYFQSDDQRHPLVEQIINEVADMPGALPLLSFTLSELYLKFLERQSTARKQGESLDRAILESDYRAMGGVVRSLTQRADQEYNALVERDPAYAQTIRNVMLRMIAVGGGEVTRRRVPLTELAYSGAENERVRQVVQRYSAARLLVEGQDLTGQSYVEPAHDALVSGWQKLLIWQREEENLMLQRRLTPAALEWEKEQKPRFLWNADPRLDILQQRLNTSKHWLNQSETKFVRCSIARKRLNNQLRTGGTLTVIFLLSAGLLAALIGQRQSKIEETRFSRESARLSLGQNHSLEGLLYSLSSGDSLAHPLLRWIQPEKTLQTQVAGTLQWAIFNVREQNRIGGHSGPVRSQWSPDGTKIATAGEDGLIQLWDIEAQQSTRWQADSQGIQLARFSPDGRWIASAGESGIVNLWTLKGEKLAELTGHDGIVSYVGFSPDGRRLASLARGGELVLWSLSEEPEDSEPLTSWQVTSKRAKSVYFHPQRPWLVTTDVESIKLWDFNGELIREFAQHAWSAVFTPDGKQIIAAGDDGQVGVWDVETGDRIYLWRADRQRLWNLILSPDGQQIATAGEDGIVKLWTFAGDRITQFRNHTGPARSVSFSPDGGQIASAGDDSSTRIWTTQSPASSRAVRPSGSSQRLQLIKGGAQIVSGGEDGNLLFWSIEDQLVSPIENPVESENPEANNRSAIRDIDVDSTGNIIASIDAIGGGAIRDLTQPEKIEVFQLPDTVVASSIALSPGAQQLAIDIVGETVLLIDRTNGQTQTISPAGGTINRLAFSADSKRLAIASENGVIQLWNTQTNRMEAQLQDHIGPVSSIAFSSADLDQLASAGTDGTVRLWNTDTQQSIGSPFQVYNQSVVAVAFSPDGRVVASGDRTGAIQLWDTAQQEQIATWQAHSEAIQDIKFGAKGQHLITAGAEGGISVWALDSFETLMAAGCDRIRNFLKHSVNQTSIEVCKTD
ncbi:MAG: caspase family protein [Cyanobacteria bacterium P01_D01_bin.1]